MYAAWLSVGLCFALLVPIIALRHIWWEKCGHGLTSRPRESSSELFLDELLGLFRYPPRSGRALLAGTLPLKYCAARFACKTPTWQLPVSGHAARLVAIWHLFMLSCLFFMYCGLARGCLWRRLILVIFDQGVQFQCRLFLLVQALIFGAHAVSLGL